MPASRNRVTMVVRTKRADIVPLILARFDGVGKMEIALEAPRWEGGRGTLIVTAVDKRGQPVANLDCVLDARDIRAVSALNNLQNTGDDGRCRFLNVGATDIEVSLQGRLRGKVVEFGHGIATVRDGEEVMLPITVTRDESPD
jgi:hypothetical protein